MRTVKRLAALAAILVALIGTGTTVANAAPADWACNSGDLCVYNGADGTGGRCAWSNADNNWLVAPVTCSWAGSRATYSINNSGTSSAYTGVMMYLSPDYQNPFFCMPQQQSIELPRGVLFRSHKWVTTSCHGVV